MNPPFTVSRRIHAGMECAAHPEGIVMADMLYRSCGSSVPFIDNADSLQKRICACQRFVAMRFSPVLFPSHRPAPVVPVPFLRCLFSNSVDSSTICRVSDGCFAATSFPGGGSFLVLAFWTCFGMIFRWHGGCLSLGIVLPFSSCSYYSARLPHTSEV